MLELLNANNFMDGINGMTGGYSMVVIGSLWYINTFEVLIAFFSVVYVLFMRRYFKLQAKVLVRDCH